MTDAVAAGLSSTLCVHAEDDSRAPGALDSPLVLSSAFHLGTAEQSAAAFLGETDAYVYGRWQNPTVAELERVVAQLEGGAGCVATASGMAAVSATLLSLCGAGAHVVAPTACYGETSRLLRERLPSLGIATTFVDDATVAAYQAALRPETRVLWVETPANPVLAITDVRAVAELGRAHGAVTVVDNTFATPYCQRPLTLGAELVVHSATKGLGGHGDAIGGCVVGSDAQLASVRRWVTQGLGGVLSPFNAWLILRGIRTLALRQERACHTAARLAQVLTEHPAVQTVRHPSLPTHPGHDVACRQMTAFGSLLAFELVGGIDAGRRVLDRVRLISHAVSLGDVRSLITHPASTTALNMPPEVRRAAGIGDGLLRLSVGIEDRADLLADLEQALG
ncbi:MAG: aminotransferase class I/II-fold pyridoxal phosphate-dependent enzyme [Polyangiaceae bacterium]|nr:aminotransferase class I/II-fold pyridoxal phosphate-dependent enzyme [Polyangiaceae bacterium]